MKKSNSALIALILIICFMFPLTPNYLLFIAKGTDLINIVDYRIVGCNTIKYLNNIIKQNCNEMIISSNKNSNEFI